MNTNTRKHRSAWTVAAIVAAATLSAACNRTAEQATAPAPTVGQQVDRTIADVTDKTKDVTITTKVNAELARDPALSALSIDVDTVDGRVSLRGKAPDAAALERATTLARGVEGVVSVDNQLVVEPRK